MYIGTFCIYHNINIILVRLAGGIAAVATSPLEVIKTRLQVNTVLIIIIIIIIYYYIIIIPMLLLNL